MRKYFKYYVGISLVIYGIMYFYFPTEFSQEEYYNNVLKSTLKEEYNGIIIEKFIDKNEHLYRKVVILQNGRNRTILFNFESVGLFNFFKVGDTIVKQKDSLSFKIKRINLDTVIRLKLDNVIGYEKYENK